MRRLFSLLLCLGLLPGLCGCGLLAEDRREVEQLQVMQVMGLDAVPTGLRLSLASASGRDELPVCLSAEGASVSAALDRLRGSALQEEIFCGHIRQLLIGEALARQGLDPSLRYICRSADMRLDLPVFVVRGAEAQTLMSDAGDGETGIDQILQAAELRLNQRGDGGYFTAAQLIRNLERQGSSLVCALSFEEAAQEEARTAVLSGLGIIKNGKLLRFLDEDNAIGALFLTNTLSEAPLNVHDLEGRIVTLQLHDGSTKLQPLWNEDGTLQGLDLQVAVSASLLESPGGDDSGSDAYADYLTAQLETAVSERISAALQLAKRLQADFLDLGPRVEAVSPRAYRALGQPLGALLPELEISLSVRGALRHGNDMV